MRDNKNILIAIAVATLVWAGCLYHTTTVNALQEKYEKTCASSVKKSEKISQLVRELNNER
jgi:outer membrane murein-binding lipoprotein Lpp